jgi:hypothetical protein
VWKLILAIAIGICAGRAFAQGAIDPNDPATKAIYGARQCSDTNAVRWALTNRDPASAIAEMAYFHCQEQWRAAARAMVAGNKSRPNGLPIPASEEGMVMVNILKEIHEEYVKKLTTVIFDARAAAAGK